MKEIKEIKRRKEKINYMIKRFYDDKFSFYGVCICGWYGFQDGYFFEIEEDSFHEVLEPFSFKGCLNAVTIPLVEVRVSLEDSIEEGWESFLKGEGEGLYFGDYEDYAFKAFILENKVLLELQQDIVSYGNEFYVVIPQSAHKKCEEFEEKEEDAVSIKVEGIVCDGMFGTWSGYDEFLCLEDEVVFDDINFYVEGFKESGGAFSPMKFLGVISKEEMNKEYFRNLIDYNSRALIFNYFEENGLVCVDNEGSNKRDKIFSYFWSFLDKCGVVGYFNNECPFKILFALHCGYSRGFKVLFIRLKDLLLRRDKCLEDFLLFANSFLVETKYLVSGIALFRSCRPQPFVYKRRALKSLSMLRSRFREDNLALIEREEKEGKKRQKDLERREKYIKESEERRALKRQGIKVVVGNTSFIKKEEIKEEREE